MEAGTFVDEAPYMLAGGKGDKLSEGGIRGGPVRAYERRIGNRPGLFDGYVICCHGEFRGVGLEKKQICELVRMAGGSALSRLPDRIEGWDAANSHSTHSSIRAGGGEGGGGGGGGDGGDGSSPAPTRIIVVGKDANYNEEPLAMHKKHGAHVVWHTWVLSCLSSYSIIDTREHAESSQGQEDGGGDRFAGSADRVKRRRRRG